MTAYAALDVSKKSTSIHIVDEKGACLWRGKTLTDPDALAAALSPFADDLALVGLETGCWTTWFWHELTDRGFPMVCMDARQAHAALSISINKTDANDAQGLAHLLRTGLYREVRVKGWEDMRKRALLRARATMLRCALDLANAMRGALRTFGISLAAGTGNGGAKTFERRVIAGSLARGKGAGGAPRAGNSRRGARRSEMQVEDDRPGGGLSDSGGLCRGDRRSGHVPVRANGCGLDRVDAKALPVGHDQSSRQDIAARRQAPEIVSV